LSAPDAAGTSRGAQADQTAGLLVLALALSLGAAVSLGITRFAYGLLLPSMRTDLNWSYALAGAMNTANALGYFLGALLTPRLLKQFGPSVLLWSAALLCSAFMVLSGFFTATEPLLLQRLLAGVASAVLFVTGGLLAARLGARDPSRSGFLLGLYYGGTGFGIALSSVLVPWVLDAARTMAAWPVPAPVAGAATTVFRWQQFVFGLSGYAMFGVGYIGYMTFVVALLREQGRSGAEVTVFYGLLGLAVVASSRIWARLLDKYRDGRALALLNALLGLATILPALTASWPVVMVSGLLFGGVFLSVVASTTALVRHNLPQAAWVQGISAFTAVFAAGQIVGPTVVGWIADGPGGLERGLVFSALSLWVGTALALRQKALTAHQ